MWKVCHKISKENKYITVFLRVTLIKKKIKFSSYIGKFRVEQLQKSYIRKGFLIYEEMHKYFPIYEEAVNHI